jgi:hypothetical protein
VQPGGAASPLRFTPCGSTALEVRRRALSSFEQRLQCAISRWRSIETENHCCVPRTKARSPAYSVRLTFILSESVVRILLHFFSTLEHA